MRTGRSGFLKVFAGLGSTYLSSLMPSRPGRWWLQLCALHVWEASSDVSCCHVSTIVGPRASEPTVGNLLGDARTKITSVYVPPPR